MREISNIKIKNFRTWFVFLIFVFCIFPAFCGIPLLRENFNCYAQPLSSTELISNAKHYDGKAVVYEGEVIGDIMVRGKYVWLNINDGNAAIGVWVDGSLIKDILYTGSYRAKGDCVEMIGIFQRSCLQHGGDLDIHAQALRRIRTGRPVVEKLNLQKRNLILVLLGIALVAWILKQLRTK